MNPKEQPPPKPAPGTRQRVNIKLGSKRYALTITATAEALKDKPAEIIELPKTHS